MPDSGIDAEFPEKLDFLFRPHLFKVLYGGRDACKSWGAARALLILGYQTKKRILCARETQESIEESVHQLLEEQIDALGLADYYRVEKKRILGKNGTELAFAGIRQNVRNVKSFEGFDICWVEEANNVSHHSWEVLLPTIRKEGSEIWVTFNPELATDDTYKRWVLNPPRGSVVVKMSYRDNLWLTESSRVKMEHMRELDPVAFEYVYEGNCKTEVEGAIFSKEMRAATTEGRIGTVPYNRTRPVDTAWDLGFGDATTIWFVQAYDGFLHFIDYEQGSGLTITDYILRLQAKGYVYGIDWVPHDAIDTMIHQKLSGMADRSQSIEQIMRNAGRNVRLVAKGYVTDRINAARTRFPQCRFDSEKCADGLQGLRHYQWGPPTAQGVSRREPLHNWASHPADGFQSATSAIQEERAAKPAKKITPRPPVWRGDYAPFG